MLRLSFALLLLFLSVSFSYGQNLRTPQPSPTESIKQDFGMSSIELVYSRPGMKGRKIFGELVPYGKVWRTGANSATYIKFNDDVMLAGHEVKAGEYALYTIPNNNSWEIILNKGYNKSGTEYSEAEDVLRFNVNPVTINYPVETFTMQFGNVKSSSVDLQLMWDKTLVSIPITADIDKKVMAQIEDVMKNDNRPYFQAALYYLENGKDLNQALLWLNKATDQNPEAYWAYHQKANALARLGRKDEAKAAALKSIDLATKAHNDDYVRLNQQLIARL
jgi:tetratricopeptide (TPR) repeat protein